MQVFRDRHGSRLLRGYMGKPRLNISLLLARFFLRPVVSCHLTAAKNRSLPNDSVSTCAGSREVPSVLFSEKAKATQMGSLFFEASFRGSSPVQMRFSLLPLRVRAS